MPPLFVDARPSPMKRRHTARSTFLALFAVLLLAASMLAVPKLDGSQTPPGDYPGLGVQRLLDSAQKAGAQIVYPERYASATELLGHARIEMNEQLARHWGLRDFGPAQDLMDRAQKEAFSLSRDTSILQEGLLRRLDQALAAARNSLAHAEEMADVSQQASAVRSVLASASMQLQLAQAYRKAGQYRRALQVAADSRRKSALVSDRSSSTLARFQAPHNLSVWREWIRKAVGSSRGRGGTAFVVVKDKHLVEVYKAGRLRRSFPVDLGANFVSQKRYAGDRATPEGLYRIVRKKGPKSTKYNLALLLDYPNRDDRRRYADLRQRGALPPGAAIGGLIEIHGKGGRGYDWTDGCVAPDDKDMEIIYNEARVGTLVAIVGSDGDGPVAELLEKTERSR